jgi:hypothetical protein
METPTVCIDGVREMRRYVVYVAGEKLLLQGATFRSLTILAIARQKNQDDGWVRKEVLYGDTATVPKYMYRLGNDVREVLSDRPRLSKWPVFENDRQGGYRLLTTPDKIKIINLPALMEFGDHVILEMLTVDISPKS